MTLNSGIDCCYICLLSESAEPGQKLENLRKVMFLTDSVFQILAIHVTSTIPEFPSKLAISKLMKMVYRAWRKILVRRESEDVIEALYGRRFRRSWKMVGYNDFSSLNSEFRDA